VLTDDQTEEQLRLGLIVVPSKTDAEPLIPMSPGLVAALLAVQRRAKNGAPHVPLPVRYDPHEKAHGQPLPHCSPAAAAPAPKSSPSAPCSTPPPTGPGLVDHGEPASPTYSDAALKAETRRAHPAEEFS
jgi:hypothetical protein